MQGKKETRSNGWNLTIQLVFPFSCHAFKVPPQKHLLVTGNHVIRTPTLSPHHYDDRLGLDPLGPGSVTQGVGRLRGGGTGRGHTGYLERGQLEFE